MKARIFRQAVFVFASLLAGSPLARSQVPPATEMVRRYDRLLRGETDQWRVEVTVKTPRWERS